VVVAQETGMFRLPKILRGLLLIFLPVFCVQPLRAQPEHSHGTSEKLGTVSFPISCAAEVQQEFNRGIALLHSFDYAGSEHAFQRVAERDSTCAMAHWGIAMTYFHQLGNRLLR
jgi:hypothetical protein